ncbi:MAG: LysR family transcriptional regulator [Pseudodesulfovibrio sp.]|nr:LysR family transcriptional regulator [Pseudodesulfovibrio sp.]
MDIRKLEAFCKVYELQNFSKAGDAMFLSQPTISSHVANLEAELGVKLFDRFGRKVSPTQAGDVLYGNAVSIFQSLEQAKAAIEILRDKVVGELKIGCSTIPSHNIMPALLANFTKRYPDVSFVVHTSDSSEVIKRVAVGDWPVGIVGQKPNVEGLKSQLLLEDETVVVAASDSPWLPAIGQIVGMDQLIKLPWVMREKGSATRRVLEDTLIDAGLSLRHLNVRCWVDGTCETLAHTLSGVGISMTSLLACREYIQSGQLTRLVVPELEGRRKFYLIYHGGRHIFPALKAFIDFIS